MIWALQPSALVVLVMIVIVVVVVVVVAMAVPSFRVGTIIGIWNSGSLDNMSLTNWGPQNDAPCGCALLGLAAAAGHRRPGTAPR